MEDRYFSFNMSSESMKAAFPNPVTRLRFVDLMCECNGLQRHHNWTWSTMKEAERRGDGERVAFYRGLEKEILRDWEAVCREAIPVYNAIMPGAPFEGLPREIDAEEKREEWELGDERSELSWSVVIARDEEADSEEPDSLKDI